MTDGFRYNQLDVNQSTQRNYQNVLKKLSVYAYDFIKFVANFVRAMMKEITGK